jgi:integrase
VNAKQLSALKQMPGRYLAGPNLYLEVKSATNSGWVFRFCRSGRERWMSLGPTHTISLAQARIKAQQARLALLEGQDPLEVRKAARAAAIAAAAKSRTFREVAEAYYNQHSLKWSSAKHRAEVWSTLDRYAFPHLGGLPVASIDTALVLKVLEAGDLWRSKSKTADALRGRIENILDYATTRGYRGGENPARWRGHLSEVLPAPGQIAGVKHFAAMPYVELGAFVGNLRRQQSIAAQALEFLILTAARSGEVVGARWEEVDLEAATWTVPAARMKGRKAHSVPLSERALELLRCLPREDGNDYLFVGARAGENISEPTMRRLMRQLGRREAIHGFRSSFRDWAAECTNFAREIAEMCLSHTVGNAVERAYRRSDLLEKRRKLMTAWAGFLDASLPGAVVPLRRVG